MTANPTTPTVDDIADAWGRVLDADRAAIAAKAALAAAIHDRADDITVADVATVMGCSRQYVYTFVDRYL